MATAARLAIPAWRNETFVRTIRVVGLDLTSSSFGMQVRLKPDTPDVPLVDLDTVTTAVEGIRLTGDVDTSGAVPVSTLTVQIAAATLQGLPYSGELGADTVLAYALQIDGQTRLYGDFVVLASTYGSDSAPAQRDGGSATVRNTAPWDAAALTVTDGAVEIVIDGVAAIAAIAADLIAAKDQAEAAALSAGLAFSGSAAETLRDDSTNFGAASRVSSGYLDSGNGSFVSNTGYAVTDFISVNTQDVFDITVPVIPTSTGTSSVFFFAADKETLLGTYRMLATTETLAVADHYPASAFIRVVSWSTAANGFTVRNKVAFDAARVTGINRDLFTLPGLRNGYIASASGAFVSHKNWRTTPPIPAYSGQRFLVTATSTSLVATVSMWDRLGNWLGNAKTGKADGLIIAVEHDDLAFIRLSASVTTQEGFYKPMTALGAVIGDPLEMPEAIIPYDIYVADGEKWPLHPRSMAPDTRFPINWNKANADDRVYTYDATAKTTSGVETITIGTTLAGGFKVQLASVVVHYYPVPTNPAGYINVICLGDSTIQGTGSFATIGDYLDWPNELSWQLTGVGRRCADDAGYFTSWGLDHILFRGTRGTGTIFHEGRGGWTVRNYLDNASVGGVPNAFWNPAANSGAGGFDLDYFLQQQNWNSTAAKNASGVADPTGVDDTGSNLIIPLALGWNDVETRTDDEMVADLSELIDAIRAARPDTRIIINGHSPSPVLIPIHRGAFTNDRYLSPRWIMSYYLLRLNSVMERVAAAKSVYHLQWQPQFDGETCFANYDTADTMSPYSSIKVTPWSSQSYVASADYVHPGRRGNMAWAHALKGFLAQPGLLG